MNPQRDPVRILGKALIAAGGVIVIAAFAFEAWMSRQIVVGAFMLGGGLAGIGVVVLALRWRP